jgi:hypothetical protein
MSFIYVILSLYNATMPLGYVEYHKRALLASCTQKMCLLSLKQAEKQVV